jgi:hypothetical protein
MEDKKKRCGHVDIYRSPVPFSRVTAIAASTDNVVAAGRVYPSKLFILDSSTAQLGVMDANMGVKVRCEYAAPFITTANFIGTCRCTRHWIRETCIRVCVSILTVT